MISYDATLSFKMLREIFQTGFSRIPVYGPSGRDEIVGLLFVKDLIFVDPEDETPVKRFTEILGRTFEVVEEDDKLGDVLTIFKQGRGHMAVVRGILEHDDGRDNEYKIKGIVTLEDIVEAILGDEIIDETDQFVHMESRDKVNRKEFDYGRLDLLDSKLNENILAADEVSAIAAHLTSNYTMFQTTENGAPIDIHYIKLFISTINAMTLFRQGTGQESGAQVPAKDVIYKRGRASTKLTLVLSGKLSVSAGKDEFRSEAGPWTVLGSDAVAMEEGTYLPDFTAYIATDTVRCIQISRHAWLSFVNKRFNNGGDGEDEPDQSRRATANRFAKLSAARKRLSKSGVELTDMSQTTSQTTSNLQTSSSSLKSSNKTTTEQNILLYSSEKGNRIKAFSECSEREYDKNLNGSKRSNTIRGTTRIEAVGSNEEMRSKVRPKSSEFQINIDIDDPEGLPPPKPTLVKKPSSKGLIGGRKLKNSPNKGDDLIREFDPLNLFRESPPRPIENSSIPFPKL
jgi:CRP-like cAMP-binding protein